MKNEVFLYVPEIFDPSLFPKLEGLHDEAYWFLHKIIALQIFYRHQGRKWANISQQTIRQFIHPSQANIVRFTLLANHVIETDGLWRKGCKSLGYRLARPYRGDIKRVQVRKPSLIAKILRHRIRREDKPIPESTLEAVHQHLLAFLRRVRIDTTRAYQIVDAMPDEKPTTKKLGSRKRCRMVKAYRKAMNRVTIDQIGNQEFDYVICKQGRVHTPITRLFTDARTCLSIDGKPLASIDITNSQLIFFALLFLEHQYNQRAEDTDGKEICEDSIGNASISLPSALFSPSCTTMGSSIALSDVVLPSSASSSPSCTRVGAADGEQFISLVMDGNIYDYLMGRCREIGVLIASRREFKRLFFQQVLYGDNGKFYASQLPLAILFQTEFPTVWDFILEQKRWKGEGPKGEAFKRLAILMQQRESRYMIGHVCRRLMEYHPEIPILTIHDSILTNLEYIPTVQRIMAEEFARLGVQPRLRIE